MRGRFIWPSPGSEMLPGREDVRAGALEDDQELISARTRGKVLQAEGTAWTTKACQTQGGPGDWGLPEGNKGSCCQTHSVLKGKISTPFHLSTVESEQVILCSTTSFSKG